MARLNQQFDSNQYPSDGEDRYAPMPEGWYAMQAVESEIETFRSGGTALKFKHKVIGLEQNGQILPKHRGRVVFTRHTYTNDNQQAMDIGRREIGELARSAGVPQFHDTTQLHGRPVLGRVIIEKGGVNQRTGEQYRDKNKVVGYKPMPGSQMPGTRAPHRPHPGAQQNQQQPRHPQAPPGRPVPPQQAPPQGPQGGYQQQQGGGYQQGPPPQQPNAVPAQDAGFFHDDDIPFGPRIL